MQLISLPQGRLTEVFGFERVLLLLLTSFALSLQAQQPLALHPIDSVHPFSTDKWTHVEATGESLLFLREPEVGFDELWGYQAGQYELLSAQLSGWDPYQFHQLKQIGDRVLVLQSQPYLAWETDGTLEGTHRIQLPEDTFFDSQIGKFQVEGGYLFFRNDTLLWLDSAGEEPQDLTSQLPLDWDTQSGILLDGKILMVTRQTESGTEWYRFNPQSKRFDSWRSAAFNTDKIRFITRIGTKTYYLLSQTNTSHFVALDDFASETLQQEIPTVPGNFASSVKGDELFFSFTLGGYIEIHKIKTDLSQPSTPILNRVGLWNIDSDVQLFATATGLFFTSCSTLLGYKVVFYQDFNEPYPRDLLHSTREYETFSCAIFQDRLWFHALHKLWRTNDAGNGIEVVTDIAATESDYFGNPIKIVGDELFIPINLDDIHTFGGSLGQANYFWDIQNNQLLHKPLLGSQHQPWVKKLIPAQEKLLALKTDISGIKKLQYLHPESPSTLGESLVDEIQVADLGSRLLYTQHFYWDTAYYSIQYKDHADGTNHLLGISSSPIILSSAGTKALFRLNQQLFWFDAKLNKPVMVYDLGEENNFQELQASWDETGAIFTIQSYSSVSGRTQNSPILFTNGQLARPLLEAEAQGDQSGYVLMNSWLFYLTDTHVLATNLVNQQRVIFMENNPYSPNSKFFKSGTQLYFVDNEFYYRVYPDSARLERLFPSNDLFLLTHYQLELDGTGGFWVQNRAGELWHTQGTLETSIRVHDHVGQGGFAIWNGTCYFSGYDALHGLELWSSQGTPATTTLLSDLWPGAISSQPHGFLALEGQLLFAAYSADKGTQLYTLCDGEEPELRVNATCQAATFQVSLGHTGPGMSFNWQVTGGTILSGQGSNAIQVQPNTSNLELRLELDTPSGCGYMLTRSLQLDANAPDAPTGLQASYSGCPGQVLTELSVDAVPGLTYQWELPEGSLILSGQDSASISVLTPLAGTVRVSAGNACAFSAATSMELDFTNAPRSADAGSDQVSCESSIQLAGNLYTGATGSWQIMEGHGGSFDDPSKPDALFSGEPNMLYRLRWELQVPECMPSSDECIVGFSPGNHSLYSNVAGCDQGAELGFYFINFSAMPVQIPGHWEVLSGPDGGSFEDPQQVRTHFNGPGGSYHLRWNFNTSFCGVSELETQFTLTNSVNIVAISPAQTLLNGEAAMIQVEVTGHNQGIWSVASGPATSSSQFTEPEALDTVFAPQGGPGTYVLRWTSLDACTTRTIQTTVDVSTASGSIQQILGDDGETLKNASQIYELGGQIYFIADDSLSWNGKNLWSCPASGGLATRVALSDSIGVRIHGDLKDQLLVEALSIEGSGWSEFWRIDSHGNSERLGSWRFDQNLWRPAFVFDNQFYFFVEAFSHSVQLWRTDLSIEGTQFVSDFDGPIATSPVSIETGLGFYFLIQDHEYSARLWFSDGTTQGTHLVHKFDYASRISLLGVLDGNFRIYMVPDNFVGQIWNFPVDGNPKWLEFEESTFYKSPFVINGQTYFVRSNYPYDVYKLETDGSLTPSFPDANLRSVAKIGSALDKYYLWGSNDLGNKQIMAVDGLGSYLSASVETRHLEALDGWLYFEGVSSDRFYYLARVSPDLSQIENLRSLDSYPDDPYAYSPFAGPNFKGLSGRLWIGRQTGFYRFDPNLSAKAAIQAPDSVCFEAEAFAAKWLSAPQGAALKWHVVNGTLLEGQGTDSISVRPNGEGPLYLVASAASAGKTYAASVGVVGYSGLPLSDWSQPGRDISAYIHAMSACQ